MLVVKTKKAWAIVNLEENKKLLKSKQTTMTGDEIQNVNIKKKLLCPYNMLLSILVICL